LRFAETGTAATPAALGLIAVTQSKSASLKKVNPRR
jgi:hypothetical protein